MNVRRPLQRGLFLPRGSRPFLAAIALVAVGVLFLSTASGIETASAQEGTPMPLPDRLVEPVLPENPTQVDLGSYDYWLHCMPCHGDQGQGLTDEFRFLYPPEHQNCWSSGCHGARPYENGWTLPDEVPAVVGAGVIKRFGTAAGLQVFIRSSMPWHDPASLQEEEYWRITAYLLDQNRFDGLPNVLGPENGFDLLLGNVESAQEGELNESRWNWNEGLSGQIVLVASMGLLFLFGVVVIFNRSGRG
jgi:hypothetical protein